jgi:hypothetical protein
MRLGFKVWAAVVLVVGAVDARWFLLNKGLDRAEKWVCRALDRAGHFCAGEAV